MKQTISFLAILILFFAGEPPAHYTCFLDRKIDSTTHAWNKVSIPVIFDYPDSKVIIFSETTLTLKITSLGKHFYNKDGNNQVEMGAVDQEGRKCVVSFIISPDHVEDRKERLLVRWGSVVAEYCLRKE